MDSTLTKLNKNQLLNIISKMKKKDLVYIINNKIGGENDEKIIKETKNAIRKEIIFNKSKVKNQNENENNSMANNTLYNKIYENKNNN